MKWVRGLVLVGGVAGLVGCHSAYVEAVVVNRTAEAVSVVEVDYPSASFGTNTLGPGQEFKYRFKVLGSGEVKLLWTDGKRQDHTVKGPELHEGEEGGLSIAIEPGGVVGWEEKFAKR